jgi:hypothetical protein
MIYLIRWVKLHKGTKCLIGFQPTMLSLKQITLTPFSINQLIKLMTSVILLPSLLNPITIILYMQNLGIPAQRDQKYHSNLSVGPIGLPLYWFKRKGKLTV